MPDITMCKGTDCPLKLNCWRYLATESTYQSYFVNPPYDKDTQQCDSYWAYKREGYAQRTATPNDEKL